MSDSNYLHITGAPSASDIFTSMAHSWNDKWKTPLVFDTNVGPVTIGQVIGLSWVAPGMLQIKSQTSSRVLDIGLDTLRRTGDMYIEDRTD